MQACAASYALTYHLNNIHKFSPYNTSRLRYKAQPVNALQGNSPCLL
jgi:hypothetical protein